MLDICCGDSYILEHISEFIDNYLGVDNNEALPEIIEQLDGDLNVYAMAISGVPLSQYIKFIEFAEEEFDPKEYLIVVVGNDFDESLCSYKRKQGTYCFDENFELQIKFFITLLFILIICLDLFEIKDFGAPFVNALIFSFVKGLIVPLVSLYGIPLRVVIGISSIKS